MLTRSGILGGAGNLTGDVYVDFRSMADGAPSLAATGHQVLREMTSVDPTTSVPTVSGGALVAPASGQSATAAYTGFQLPEEVKSAYADVIYGDGSDSAAIIAAGDVHLPPVLASSLHIVFNATGWALQYFSAGVNTSLQTGPYPTVPFGQIVRIGWRIDGNDIYVKTPTAGEIGPLTYSEAVIRTNNAVVFEHNRQTTGAPTLKFIRIAASMFATPTAVGRTNLLVGQNNLSLWTRDNMGAPVSSQPDASGGTLADKVLETAVSSAHTVRQSVAKDASQRRYTVRAKIKMIGRDWIFMNAFDQAFGGQASRYLNMTTQALGTQSGSFTDQTWIIYPLGNGWCEVISTFKSNTGTAIQPRVCTATADGTASFAGDIVAGFYMFDQWLFERSI